MFKIILGDNIAASRKRLQEIIEKAKSDGLEVVSVSGAKITYSDIRKLLESGSLFGKTKLVVIENFLSSTKSKEKEIILDFLTAKTFETEAEINYASKWLDLKKIRRSPRPLKKPKIRVI